MRKFMTFLAFFVTFPVFSQFSDYFEDGNFTENPVWFGDMDKFEVDGEFRLHLSAEKQTSTAWLATSSISSLNTSWEFEATMKTKPTTGNYVKVYLCADTTGVGKPWGLCLRIGYNKDIALWYEPASGAGKNLLKGITGRLDIETVTMSVKATLDWSGNFQLYTRLSGEGEFLLEGETFVSSVYVPENKYFALACIYSSTKSKNTYYFDNFVVQALSDTPPPDPEEETDIFPNDIIINEILYQPYTDGDEFVELYNRSDKAIDMSFLSIASRKSDSSLHRIKPLSPGNIKLYPGEYLLVTGTKERVCNFYECRDDVICCELGTMLSLPDTGADIVLFNNQNNEVIDELIYTNKMHAEGITNPKGVSLERIDAELSTNDPANWISAMEETGYATPGYSNSRRGNGGDSSGNGDTGISIVEHSAGGKIDYFQIDYHFKTQDNRCNLLIFDLSGRLTEQVLNNSLLGENGSVQWIPANFLKTGIYIVYMEVYQLSGGVQKYKLPVVLK